MKGHLLLVLEGPLMAFGAVMVDAFGKIDDFPGRAMLTGLLGNALGYDRTDRAQLNALQSRLVSGGAILHEGERFTDVQNAKLDKTDKGWTTRGKPEKRDGGQGTYSSPHRRVRDYVANGCVMIVLRLEPADGDPSLDDLAAALREPERPLFLGRKPCLPSRPILHGRIGAPAIVDALEQGLIELAHDARTTRRSMGFGSRPVRARWPESEGVRSHDRLVEICDERDWTVGVHVGLSRVREGQFQPAVRE
jgi:CRISPR system Cascade subunit CasD